MKLLRIEAIARGIGASLDEGDNAVLLTWLCPHGEVGSSLSDGPATLAGIHELTRPGGVAAQNADAACAEHEQGDTA